MPVVLKRLSSKINVRWRRQKCIEIEYLAKRNSANRIKMSAISEAMVCFDSIVLLNNARGLCGDLLVVALSMRGVTMKMRDFACILCFCATASFAAHAVFADYADCTGWSSSCSITGTPIPDEQSTCCKSPGYAAPGQYSAAGIGAKLYISDTAECGNTADVVTMGTTNFCLTVTSNNDCGGKTALTSCTTPK